MFTPMSPILGDGPFTVFAPTDEAFMKLPAGELQHLLAHPKQLKGEYSTHVYCELITK